MQVVYVGGVWDLFHIGHLNILKYAKSLGDFLVVGINTDELAQSYKRCPIIPFRERKAILEAIRYVDFVGTHPSQLDTYWQEYFRLNIHVIPCHYWSHEYNCLRHEKLKKAGLDIKYVVWPRTPGISSTNIMEVCCEEKIHVGSCPFAVACRVQSKS